MSSLRKLHKKMLGDYPGKNPTLLRCIIASWLNPSYSVLFTYRIGQYFYYKKNKLCKLISSRKRMKLVFRKNCDISFEAKIGKKLKLTHPTSVVIGAGSIIKDDVTIYQNVTLGSIGGKEKVYPTIENKVKIYANSTIIGGVKVGENAIVGANSVVNIDVPPNAVAIGSPCKIIVK